MYRGCVMFVEFKKKGMQLKPLQKVRANELTAHSFLCLKCDELEQGRRYVELFKKRVDEGVKRS